MDNLELRPVTNNDAAFLYRLLRERDPIANISHRKMPPYAQHQGFVRTWTTQYEAWYTLWDKANIGSIYLTLKGEIGLFLLKSCQGKGYGWAALARLQALHPKKRYLANIAPGNEISAQFFERQGFKLIQKTYEWEAK